MPYKNNQKRKESESADPVTAENIETKMPQFYKYYKGIEVVPEEEWIHLLESLFTMLPFSMRFSERSRKMNNIYEGRPGIVSDSDVLRDYFKKNLLPKLAGVTIDGKPFEFKPVSWYPKQLAWVGNFDQRALQSNEELKPLKRFIDQEEKNFHVFKQRLVRLLPTMVTDIQQNFKVLELSMGGANISAVIMEQLYANPRKLPDGLVISNFDYDKSMVRVRGPSANTLYTREKPEAYPDIYLTPDHNPDTKLAYDRVFFHAPSSEEGHLKMYSKMKVGWNVNSVHKKHESARKGLKRGLELLKVKGQLVYYTFSMNPIENEAVVASVLEEAAGTVELVNVKTKVPDFFTRSGLTSWKVMTPSFQFYSTFDESPAWYQKENGKSLWPPEAIASMNMDRCLRVMPHDNNTEPLFLAVFTRTGELPWLVKEEPEIKQESEAMDTTENGAGKGDGDAKPEAAKPEGEAEGEKSEEGVKYIQPLRCDVNIGVDMMEWTTEITDEKLDTKEDIEIQNFKRPNFQINKACIPKSIQNKGVEIFRDVAPDNELWGSFKQLFDIRKLDEASMLVERVHHKDESKSFFCFVSPLLKTIIMNNMNLHRKASKFGGGLILARNPNGIEVKVVDFDILCLLPLINKRVVNVPKEDMVTVLQNKNVVFKQFTPRTKALVQALDNGPVIFFYEPKGKNPDPRCIVVTKRDKHSHMVSDDSMNSITGHLTCHNLRLCGFEPQLEIPAEEEEEEMEAE